MSQLQNIPKQSLFNASLASPINSVQTTGIIIDKLIDFTPVPGEIYRLSILNPDGAEIISFEDQNPNGELTNVTRGLELADGVAGVARAHGAGIRVTLSNPFQLYEDIQTAINSKADSSSPTIDEPTFTDWVKLPGYADGTARDAAIPTPADNMAVLLEDDGNGYACLSVYKNAQWNNIALPSEDVTVYGFLEVAGGYIRFPVYDDNTARNAAIPIPTQGMTIYNKAAVTLQLYDGSNWIDLDIGTPVPLATTSTPGRVRLATDAQVLVGTDDVGGEPLVVQPSQLEYATVISAIAEEDITANDLVGAATYVSQADIKVSKAAKTRFSAIFPSQVDTVYKVLALDSTRLFVLYQTTSTSALSGVVVTYDINTNQITSVGSKVDFATATINGADAAIVATDKVAVTYVYTASNTVCRVRPCTIATATITMGAEQTLYTAATSYTSNQMQIKQMDTDKAVVSLANNTTTNSVVIAFTLSGTTITPGTQVVPTTNLRSGAYLLRLDTNKFILVFGATTTGYVNVGSISGTTIILTSEQTFTTGGSTSNSTFRACEVDTNKIVVTYMSTGSGSADRMVCIEVPSTTISVGTPVTISSAGSSNGFAQVSAGSFLYVTQSNSIVRSGSISGTTITLTTSSYFDDFLNFDSLFNPNFNNTQIAINSIVIGITERTPTSATVNFARQGLAYTFIGQALNTATRGNAVNVKLNRPFISNLSGLRGGEVYNLGDTSATAATNGLNGTLTIVNPVTNAGSAAFLPFNTAVIALNEDTIVGI